MANWDHARKCQKPSFEEHNSLTHTVLQTPAMFRVVGNIYLESMRYQYHPTTLHLGALLCRRHRDLEKCR
jgi:hypothetical protein